MIMNNKTNKAMTEHKKRLTEEVQTLLSTLANLGNVKDTISSEDIANKTEDAQAAQAWETILDNLFTELCDFAVSKGIEVE
jgi:outer membrane murein-binding lipoprotein Lpp